jgi:hypothetical protein
MNKTKKALINQFYLLLFGIEKFNAALFINQPIRNLDYHTISFSKIGGHSVWDRTAFVKFIIRQKVLTPFFSTMVSSPLFFS